MSVDTRGIKLSFMGTDKIVTGKIGLVDAELIRYLVEVRESDKRVLILIKDSIYSDILPKSHIEEFILSTSIVDGIIDKEDLIENKIYDLEYDKRHETTFDEAHDYCIITLPEEYLKKYSEERIKNGYFKISNGQESCVINPSKLISLKKLSHLYPRINDETRIGLVSGSFDLIHLGHVRYIESARKLCDFLVVATMSTSSLQAQEKNTRGDRPIYNQIDRITVLSALKSVDHVIVFYELDCKEIIKELRPHIFVKNIKDMNREIVKEECDLVESLGGEVHVTNDNIGYSSTDLIYYIRNGKKPT
jgi:rfaE bifunctional protein nucleotidyltransferase chain/domain